MIFSCELGQMWGMVVIFRINMLIFFACKYFFPSLHDGILSFSAFVCAHTHAHGLPALCSLQECSVYIAGAGPDKYLSLSGVCCVSLTVIL